MTELAWLWPLLAIDIGMDPEIGELFGFLITWHGVFTAVGIGAGLWLALRLADVRQLDADEAYTAGVIVVVGGIVGARALFVVENWSAFEDNLGDIVALNEGGISIYGALMGGTLFGLVFAYMRRGLLPFLPLADAGAIGAILGMAIGRIGDVINGEHVSKSSDLPWAVTYSHVNSISFGLPAQHPATGYEMLGDLVIMAGLLLLFFRVRGYGWVFFTWLLAYGAMRFGLSFLREDKQVLDGLRMAQVVAIGGMAIGLAGLVWLATRAEPAGPTRAERRRGERRRASAEGR